ncbi:MAG: LamG domain-containing protein [Candidatus Thermoplasmatota archaeon]|nr:LamG domain-containing protein [Candidatus Thermoplasmatota archaeon]
MSKKRSAMILPIIILLILTIVCGCIEESDEKNEDITSITGVEQLIGYWQFEENASHGTVLHQVIDSSENNLHGSANGTTYLSPGKIGSQHVVFNDRYDHIIIPNNDLLEPDHITVEAWVKSSNPGVFGYIVSKGGQSNQFSSYGLYTDSNGGLSFYITGLTGPIKSSNAGTGIWNNEWHHVAGTFDGSSIRLYVDGIQIGEDISANTSIRYNLEQGNDLMIGNYLLDYGLSFNGSIDDVLLWDTALTHDIIYQHYRIGAEKSSVHRSPTVTSLGNARDALRSFLDPYTQNDILAIQGNRVAIQDRLLIALVQSQVKNIDNIKKISAANITQKDIEDYSVIVLLGSEKRNLYTEEIFSYHDIEISSNLYASPFLLLLGHDNSIDKDIIVIFTAAELYNLENKAAERSPLSEIIDKRYVPIAATVTSIIALYLWSIFGNTLVEFLFDFTSEKIQDREKDRKIKKKKEKASDKNLRLKELAGVFLAVLVFSTAMSWTWSSHLSEFIYLFITNIIVISIIFTIKELLRLRISKKKKMKTKHVFWPFGSALTLGSTILGNTFSLASYTYYENKEDMKQFGRMYFYIFLALYLFSLTAFILNFLFPSVIFQMMFVFAIMSVFIDMTPIEPMDGYEVKNWNFNKWLLLYILVACSYIIMNFTFFI